MSLLQTLFSFNGRTDRRTFWLCASAVVLADTAAFLAAPRPIGTQGVFLVLTVVLIVSVWSGLALKVKRLHDRGRSALYLLAALAPVAGWIWLIWEIGFAPGRRSGARFDRPAKA